MTTLIGDVLDGFQLSRHTQLVGSAVKKHLKVPGFTRWGIPLSDAFGRQL